MLRQFSKSPVSDDNRTQAAQDPRIALGEEALRINTAKRRGSEKVKDVTAGLKAEFIK